MTNSLPTPKPSYTDLVCQVVREAAEPLPFAEIMQRVNAIQPITTKNPKGTLRGAIGNVRLVVNTGDGRYGWKYRVINGSCLRLNLAGSDINGPTIEFTDELRDLLWPAFFENQKRGDRDPVNLRLPSQQVTPLALEFLGDGHWGTHGSPEFREWFGSLNAQPGDALLVCALDGEKRLYIVDLQARSARDEPAIAARNRQVEQAVLAFCRRSASGAALWEISSHLLATGQYKHPVPPDALDQLRTRAVWEPELAGEPARRGRQDAEPDDADLMIASLLEQIEGDAGHRRPRTNRGRAAAHIAPPVEPTPVFQLKITLIASQPPIWRRVLVPGDLTLARLHGVLQIVMGWTNSHLHEFQAGRHRYALPDPENDEQVKDEHQVRVDQIAPQLNDRLVYLYDFGDGWKHEIIVEKIMPPDQGVRYPQCLGGERACPPEDVGGMWGYRDFLVAWGNPRHPEHAEMRTWVGEAYDPERFDLESVNKTLQRYPAWRDAR